ncbi:MAG: hypothetical protein HZB16_16640 [Armatimonadetes bacterium]|nr:hypothetical protein [Armatimonadota bacterium]
MGTARYRWLAVAGAALLAGCTRPPARAVATTPPVRIAAFVVVDQHFEPRFGALAGNGRARLNEWLYLAARQFQLAYPGRRVEVSVAGTGRWTLPDGPTRLATVYRDNVPRGVPHGSRANCLIAVAARPDINWGGMASWPRLLFKAQVHEPTDVYTTGLLCHEMSHWFGAVDLDDTRLPERSVMNYRDATGGWVDGRIAWDNANRCRVRDGLLRWPV